MLFSAHRITLLAQRLRPHNSSSLIAVTALLACVFFGTRAAHAQAQVAAARDLSIDAYAGASAVSPHVGPDREIGYMVGGDIEKYFRLVDVALDVRYNSATGTYADESSILVGIRAARTYHRFHPYIEFLAGHGNVKFDHPDLFGNPTFTHDDSTVYDGGIGVDYSLTPRFAVKLDAQVQRWHTGYESQVFNPNSISLGVVYHVPFRYLRPRRY